VRRRLELQIESRIGKVEQPDGKEEVGEERKRLVLWPQPRRCILLRAGKLAELRYLWKVTIEGGHTSPLQSGFRAHFEGRQINARDEKTTCRINAA